MTQRALTLPQNTFFVFFFSLCRSFACFVRCRSRDLTPFLFTLLQSLMPFEVESQMVGAGEGAVAVDALERFGTRVLAVVAGQFVRTGEPPLAAFPRALVRFFTCHQKEKKKNGLSLDLEFIQIFFCTTLAGHKARHSNSSSGVFTPNDTARANFLSFPVIWVPTVPARPVITRPVKHFITPSRASNISMQIFIITLKFIYFFISNFFSFLLARQVWLLKKKWMKMRQSINSTRFIFNW